jgi:hypothetical protein
LQFGIGDLACRVLGVGVMGFGLEAETWKPFFWGCVRGNTVEICRNAKPPYDVALVQ